MAEKKRKADADAAEVPDGTMGVSKVEQLEAGKRNLNEYTPRN